MRELIFSIVITVAGLVLANICEPKSWSAAAKRIFRWTVAPLIFLAVGAYYLATGDEPDKLAYRILICPIYQFERCSQRTESHTSAMTAPDPVNVRQANEKAAMQDAEFKKQLETLARIEKAQQELLKERQNAPNRAEVAQPSPRPKTDTESSNNLAVNADDGTRPEKVSRSMQQFGLRPYLYLNGADLRGTGFHADLVKCADECLADSTCIGFTYIPDEEMCLLKGEVSKGKPLTSYRDDRSNSYLKKPVPYVKVN